MTLGTLSADNAHLELTRSAALGRLTEPDALLWMVLLHTHEIRVHSSAIAGVIPSPTTPEIVRLPALTQNGVATVAAQLWGEIKKKRGRPADDRSAPSYWYWKYNTEARYEFINDVPQPLHDRLFEFRDRLKTDPRVVDVLPED